MVPSIMQALRAMQASPKWPIGSRKTGTVPPELGGMPKSPFASAYDPAKHGRTRAEIDAEENAADEAYLAGLKAPPKPVNPAFRTPDALALLVGALAGGSNFGDFLGGYMGAKAQKAGQDTEAGQAAYQAAQARARARYEATMAQTGRRRATDDWWAQQETMLDAKAQEERLRREMEPPISAKTTGASETRKPIFPGPTDAVAKSRLQQAREEGWFEENGFDAISQRVGLFAPARQAALAGLFARVAERQRRAADGDVLPYSYGQWVGIYREEISALEAELRPLKTRYGANGPPSSSPDYRRYRSLTERYEVARSALTEAKRRQMADGEPSAPATKEKRPFPFNSLPKASREQFSRLARTLESWGLPRNVIRGNSDSVEMSFPRAKVEEIARRLQAQGFVVRAGGDRIEISLKRAPVLPPATASGGAVDLRR